MMISYRLKCKSAFAEATIARKAESYGYMFIQYGEAWIKSSTIDEFIIIAKSITNDFTIEKVTIDNSRATFVKFVSIEDLKLN